MATINDSITALGKIVTDAITAGDTSTLPEKAVRTTLVRIATGSYKEVLPIMVPAECCIMGDELRATNVQPRTVYNSPDLTPKTDFWYSYAGMNRMQNIIGDVVSGVAVTPTTGNLLDQNQTWPYASNPQAKNATVDLARNIKRRSDIGLGLKHEVRKTLPRPADMGTPANGHARDLIWRNVEFLKNEVTAYLTTEYPNLDYSRTKCKQDVNFIIDALAYDLTYGGNWQTQTAGLAYYNGASGVLQIDSEELTATLAVYNYLKGLMQTVQRNITVTPVYQTDSPQVIGEGGGATQSTTIGTLIDDMLDIVENGTAQASITYPALVGVSADKLTANTNVTNGLASIQETTIDFIAKNFGSFKYDAAKCRRDLGYILSDISYDMVFNTNYNAVYDGIAYQRANSQYLLSAQKTETIGAIRHARNLMIPNIADATAKARFESGMNEIVDVLRNGTLSATEPGDGVADALVFTNPTGGAAADISAKNLLVANRDFIKADVVAYVENTYNSPPGSFVYSSSKCSRDMGYIVDALTYDVLYGTNMASVRTAHSYFVNGDTQVYGQEAETVAAYNHAKSIIAQIVQEQTVTAQAGNAELQTTLGSASTLAVANEIGGLLDIISDAITAGNTNGLPTIVYPTITGESAALQTAHAAIATNQAQNIVDVIQYISDTYNDFNYNHAKCQRDLGLLIDAARYDWMLGTEYASVISALSYLRRPSAKVTGDQKDATIAANEYARGKFAELTDGVSVDASEGLEKSWEWIQDAIWTGSAEGGNRACEDQEVFNAIRMLELNKDFIAEEVVAYVEDYFQAQITDTVGANPGGTSDYQTIDDTSWLEIGMPIRYSIQAGDTETDLQQNLSIQDQIYYVREVLSNTTFRVEDNQGNIASFTASSTTYTIKKDYAYNQATCKRDVREYVDAIKWDLEWPQEFERNYTNDVTVYRPGAYKTRMAVRYYVNSIIGSQEEDFYYMRNGTGLRLQSLDGLNGDLSPNNEFGTKRPTAGAYASLDPGWGPDDTRVWISARSPYMQNCSCFGNAAIGQKIDGSLHNGGNDSMVSNDFTQVISDGIGAWITNNGRAELVSVFTYYSHIGYLAENGGRIRATNGNNSYGSFGSVAEGVDPDEVPVTGVVDNISQYNATIGNVVTDTASLLALEYSHAGNGYTEAAINIFGAGTGEVLVADEFRDGAVNRVKIDETTPDTAGGSGYTVVSNTAQTGTTTSISLAATDGAISSAYVGMRVYVTGGAAVGQYATILNYNSGSKLANVVKNDGTAGWEHVIAGTPVIAPNGSSTYQVEPHIEFSAPANNQTDYGSLAGTGTHQLMHYFETSAQYVNIATTTNGDGNGATFDITRNGEKYYVSINGTGQEYVRNNTVTIPGTSVGGATPLNDITVTITTINAATGAIVDFDISGIAKKGEYLLLQNSGSTYNISVNGESWSTKTFTSGGLASRSAASGLLDDGSSTYKPSYMVVVGNNTQQSKYTADGENWVNVNIGANFASGDNAIAFGGSAFVVVNPNTTDTVYSLNGGATWTTGGTLPGSGYQRIAYGMGLFVAMDSGTTNIAWSNDLGLTWNAVSDVTGLTARNWLDVTWGNGRFVAIDNSGNTAISFNGDTWIDGGSFATGTVTNAQIAYGQGVFVTGGSNSSGQTWYSEDGINFTSLGNGNPAQLVSFGNPQQKGRFVQSGLSGGDTTVAEIGARARGRSSVASEKIFAIRMTEPGSNYDAGSPPTITVTDPGNIDDVELVVRVANGALANPTFVNRGSNFITASAEVNDDDSNGGADFFQSGQFVAVSRLTQRPVSGSNVTFDSIPGKTFKLVNTVSFRGLNDGSYTAFLQLSPLMSIADAPGDKDPVTMRIRFSQVRLTGHDFLDIGTGGFVSTNYPGLPAIQPDAAKETQDANGGRVFFTSTDQDGNFRVGDLFQIEQATGVATLNADAFNIAGLQELTLGEVTLGGNSAAVSEFSTDPFFTANSDSVVPTQRAVKAYIEAQIGGGGAQLNVNSVTAGDIFVNTNQITTVSGEKININANVNFTKTVLGLPIAYNYFLR